MAANTTPTPASSEPFGQGLRPLGGRRGHWLIAWAVYYFLHPDAATYDMVTLSGHASVDFLGAGIFCLLLAILFLTVRPYRPDITRAGGADVKRRLTWWTGEPR